MAETAASKFAKRVNSDGKLKLEELADVSYSASDPTDGQQYKWNETNQTWDLVSE